MYDHVTEIHKAGKIINDTISRVAWSFNKQTNERTNERTNKQTEASVLHKTGISPSECWWRLQRCTRVEWAEPELVGCGLCEGLSVAKPKHNGTKAIDNWHTIQVRESIHQYYTAECRQLMPNLSAHSNAKESSDRQIGRKRRETYVCWVSYCEAPFCVNKKPILENAFLS